MVATNGNPTMPVQLGYDHISRQRLECLHTSLTAIREWLESFFEAPMRTYRYISITYYAQLARCIISLYRLSTLDDPVWNRLFVLSEVDLVAVLDRLSKGMSFVGNYFDDTSATDFFEQTARLFRSIRTWSVARLEALDLADGNTPVQLPADSILYELFPQTGVEGTEEWATNSFGNLF